MHGWPCDHRRPSAPELTPSASALSAPACSSISTPFCTAYDTLGPAGLTHAINQPSVRAIFANGELLATVLKIIDDTPTLKTVIYDGEPDEAVVAKLRAKDGVKVLSLKELTELGKSKGEIKVVKPKRDDVCCVMYTSVSSLICSDLPYMSSVADLVSSFSIDRALPARRRESSSLTAT